MRPHLDSFVAGVGYGEKPPQFLESPWGSLWEWDTERRIYRSSGAPPKSLAELKALWQDQTIPWQTTPKRKLVVRAGDFWICVWPQTVSMAKAVSVRIPKQGQKLRAGDRTWLRDNTMHRDACARFAEKVALTLGEIAPARMEQLPPLLC